jgi:chromosome segregation ATPase
MNEEKIEAMLSQLIKMVGNSQAEQQEMKRDLQDVKREQQEMKQDLQDVKREQQEMKQDLQEVKQDVHEIKKDQKSMQEKLQGLETKGEERHKEILARFTAIETDQDFIWEKTAKNEREIAHIKGQLS